jgi:hypothetical protein
MQAGGFETRPYKDTMLFASQKVENNQKKT